MSLDNRIYLSWIEAATVLGLDSEGLRQLMRYRFSPNDGSPGESWLPAVIQSGNLEFFASLSCDSHWGEPEINWGSRDTFYRNCNLFKSMRFSNGEELPLRGAAGGERWEATHDYGTGFGRCFMISGDSLVIDPAVISSACAQDGYLGAIRVAPYNWCKDGFPTFLCFMIINSDNNMHAVRPTSLYESVQFLAQDVRRIKSVLGGTAAALDHSATLVEASGTLSPRADREKPRSDREDSLLRVIAALWALSSLPEAHNTTADKISALFDTWGWDKPRKSTIADTILKQAANLPGARIRK